MPNIERGGFGVSANGPQALINRLSLGGVVLPGSVGYDCYPSAAIPTAVTSSASNDTLGSDATVIAGSTITVPYQLMGLAMAFGEPTQVGRYRYATKVATVLVRSGLFDPRFSTGKGGLYYDSWYPYPCAANAAVTVATANDQTSAERTDVYAQVLVKPPIALSWDTLSVAKLAVQTLIPNSITGIAPTGGVGAWAFGSYVQITAGIATPILITKIIHQSVTFNVPYQMALATGAAASEVDFAIVGGPLGNVADLDGTTVFTPTYPILINASTRLSVRVRDLGGSNTGYAMWLEYYPLPAF